MAKLTIEIDMDDPQEVWDALYQRIEDFDFSQLEDDGATKPQTTLPATYDLLLDPDQVFGDTPTYFGISTRNEDA
ncbi:MAG: hypothetical protein AB8G23_07100 [Myxococcota bacterium]